MEDSAFYSERTNQTAGRRAKPAQNWPDRTPAAAFTFLEMLVVVMVGIGFMVMAFAFIGRTQPRCGCQRITCINNLKQIGVAYRIWANDNGDVFPAFASVTNGGWKELLAGPNAGALCWTNYTIMQNELGQSAKVVICPNDERQETTNYNPGIFNNLTLSYFVGADANADRPEALLAGDRNLTNLPPGSPAPKGYGFSPRNGQGNDVLVSGPLSWTKAMHTAKNPVGSGNILLGDGSAQQVTSIGFTKDFLQPALAAAQARAGATSPVGIRIIFP